jgi:hypothetical protein
MSRGISLVVRLAVYGTPHEASQIITAGDRIFPFFAMVLIGAALENFPKRRSEKNSDS